MDHRMDLLQFHQEQTGIEVPFRLVIFQSDLVNNGRYIGPVSMGRRPPLKDKSRYPFHTIP